MSSYLQYMGETSICIAVLYLSYWLFLRKETFHSLNRSILLLSVVSSIIFPLIEMNIDSPASGLNLTNTVLTPFRPEAESPLRGLYGEPDKENIPVIAVIYFTVMLFLLFRFFANLSRFTMLALKGETQNVNGARVIILEQEISPFSFFNHILMSRKDFESNNSPHIVQHETAHVRKLHSLDILLTEMLTIVQWFNPFAWLIRKSLKKIHEFEADRHTLLQKAINPDDYKMMIMRQLTGTKTVSFASNLGLSMVMERLAVMSLPDGGRWRKSRITAPVICMMLLFWQFSCKTNQNEKIAANATKLTVYSGDSIVLDTLINQNAEKPFILVSGLNQPNNEGTDVLYVGVDNRVGLIAQGISDEELIAEIDKGSIHRKGKGIYNVRVEETGEATITLSHYAGNEKKILRRMDFVCQKLPDPSATVGEYQTGKISRSLLAGQTEIKAGLLFNFPFEVKYEIVEFNFTLSRKGGELTKASVSGPQFTEEVKLLLAAVKAGDLVFFDKIKAKGPDGIPRKLPGLAFEVTE